MTADAPSPDDLLVLAATHHQAGRLAQAERLYRAVLQQLPYSADAHHNLGVLSMQGGRPVDEALRHFRLAWEADPTHPQYSASLSRALAQAGRADEARGVLADRQRRRPGRPCFEELVASLSPAAMGVRSGMAATDAEPWQACLACFDAGDLSGAQSAARSLVTGFPQDGAAWKALGLALHRQGNAVEALPAMQAACRLLPRDAQSRAALGAIFADLGQPATAEAAFREALALDPAFLLAACALAEVLGKSNRIPEAEALYRQVITTAPELAQAHVGQAELFASQGRVEESIAAYRRALALKPGHARAYPALGQIFASRRRLDEAEALCRRTLEALPTRFEAHRDLGVVLAMQGRISEAAASCRNAVRLRPDDLGVRSALLFNLGYVAGEAPETLLAEAKAYGREATRRAGSAFTSWTCAPDPQRLRVGIVSADLCEHPVGYFLESLVAGADSRRIEWVGYPALPVTDALSQRLRARTGGWQCLAGLSDEEAARRVHGDGVHVLLDLSGHTARNRLPVFAWHPAPLQASWLGYFATTGVEQMDWLLADPVGVPPDLQAQFTERIWYLPDTRLCFTPPHTDLAVAPLPALRRGHVTFGCFQALGKVNDEVLALWSRILSASSRARLRLQAASLTDPGTISALLERLRACGIDPARVDLVGAMYRGDYLAAHAKVDLLLDTFPYPGGTTTCEALWMGVPTVTLAGATMLARQGASLLCAAGLSDWVARSPEEYVTLASERAGDVTQLAALRARLREQVRASALVDARRFCRHLEDALWGMWRAGPGARGSQGEARP